MMHGPINIRFTETYTRYEEEKYISNIRDKEKVIFKFR